jgi:hypothetical protein
MVFPKVLPGQPQSVGQERLGARQLIRLRMCFPESSHGGNYLARILAQISGGHVQGLGEAGDGSIKFTAGPWILARAHRSATNWSVSSAMTRSRWSRAGLAGLGRDEIAAGSEHAPHATATPYQIGMLRRVAPGPDLHGRLVSLQRNRQVTVLEQNPPRLS